MQFPSKSYLEQLRKQYPKGTKLQMITMRNEKYPVPSGTIGEVTHVDDIGQYTRSLAERFFPCDHSGSGFFQSGGD